MKVSATQLTQHLTKKLSSLYVVSGEDSFLIQEAIDLIREAARAQGYSERLRIPVESAADLGSTFYANTQTLSLFASKRLLELDLTTIKLNAASSKILQSYTEKPPEDIILLIRANKIDSKTEQSNWYKALDKIGVMITVWPIPSEQLPAWIMQRAKKCNLNITKPAAELLATLVEGNVSAADQEITKLSLLQTTETIDHATIEKAIADSAHFDIFTLVDIMLSGNNKRCIRVLRNLAAEDTEPTLILWALAREFRTMAEIARQTQAGASLGSVFPKFRIWEKRQAGVRAFLQRHNQESCWTLLLDAAQIDKVIKGAEVGNVWDRLEQLVLRC